MFAFSPAPLLTESTGGTWLTMLQTSAIGCESTSELPYTAGSKGKQLPVVMRGEDHAHHLLPWRLKEVKVPDAQQCSRCVIKRNCVCSQAWCIKDGAFSRRWLPGSSYLPSPSTGPQGSIARATSLWVAGGTVQPEAWARSIHEGESSVPQLGVGAKEKRAFNAYFILLSPESQERDRS